MPTELSDHPRCLLENYPADTRELLTGLLILKGLEDVLDQIEVEIRDKYVLYWFEIENIGPQCYMIVD